MAWLSIFAVLSGWLYHFAFPGFNMWPLAFVAVAGFWVCLQFAGFWRGTVIGVLFFGTFYGFHIEWLTLYLGIVPWLALTVAMVLSGMLAAGLMGFVGQILQRLLDHKPWLLTAVRPITFAAIWISWEAIASRFPYGGFSWGRFTFALSDSPFVALFSWLGAAGLGFVLLALLFLMLEFGMIGAKKWWRNFQTRTTKSSSDNSVHNVPLVPIVGVVITAVVVGLLVIIPAFTTENIGSKRVAAVQGNADAALNSHNPRGTVLKNHIEATQEILDEKIDLLVWPENASDLDPLRDDFARSALNYLSDHFNAPMIAGTITKDSAGKFFNSALLWEPQIGNTQQYDKKHPVPFAEYMPNREFFMMLAPELVSLVSRDYEFGTRSSVFDLDTYQAGIAICYDIADDKLMREMVLEGADIILAPTNNADFGQTDQNQQQLAIARIRALETGRSVVNISTVGTSAIIDADGTYLDKLEPYKPGHMVVDVPLYKGITPATAMGPWLEILAGVWVTLVTIFVVLRNYFVLLPLRSRK